MYVILFIYYNAMRPQQFILYKTLKKKEILSGLVTIWVYYKINTTALLSLSLSFSEYNIIYCCTILLYIISYKTIVFRPWHYIIDDGPPQLYYYSFPSYVSTPVYGRLTTSIVTLLYIIRISSKLLHYIIICYSTLIFRLLGRHYTKLYIIPPHEYKNRFYWHRNTVYDIYYDHVSFSDLDPVSIQR